MKISQKDIQDFATILVRNIKHEFSLEYLSGNLADTIQITQTDDALQVIIPAEVYDMYRYTKEGVVIHNKGSKSYASELDRFGSTVLINGEFVHLGNHVGFVNKVIEDSLNEWITLKKKYEMVSKTII